MTEHLTIGERVAWYRRRRGMSQEVLAGLVDKSTDWVQKAENNRLELDRLSVIRSVAHALDVSIGDLIGEPTLVDWCADSRARTVPALRTALMDYSQLSPLLAGQDADHGGPPSTTQLARRVDQVFDAYQQSRFGYVTAQVPALLHDAMTAARHADQDVRGEYHEQLALSYQAAASVLTKLGESDLAWIAADRGLAAAEQAGNQIVLGSLFRSVAHTLLATGRFEAARHVVERGASVLSQDLRHADARMLSVYGTLFLTGAIAASRAEDRGTTRSYLQEAQETADRLGSDSNHIWTAFGPTNVAIHRVNTAIELGDVQVALDVGPELDTSALPTERRVRHALDVARAYSARARRDDALAVVLEAEQMAPEQVRHHFISRQLVLTWMRQQRRKPSQGLAGLASRLRLTQ
ncbi:MAG: helix-turn-helix domain-containing protein [Pseudonocardiaceae bacterium]|nr:helix-turn-helix domain-containing protein [Pseudonocardiaceae bacterium]